jgi:pimeloyl-ACP methyl ester carboxylesterase
MTARFTRRLIISLVAITLNSACIALPQPEETSPQDRFARLQADLGDLRVHYQNYGEGKEAVVFVHDWSCNLQFWRSNIRAFTNLSRVITIDLPGHGESDKPKIKYSMDLFARAIDAALTDAGVERATLIGHSMGTSVIREFYRKNPDKTRALVVVNGMLRLPGSPEQGKLFIELFRGPNYKEQAERAIELIARGVKDKQRLKEIKAAMMSTPQHVMIGAMEAIFDDTTWKQDKIYAPTLALMSRRPQWNAEYEKFVRELAPGIDYQVWDGVSHFLMMDEPQRFNDTVLTFMIKNNLIKRHAENKTQTRQPGH